MDVSNALQNTGTRRINRPRQPVVRQVEDSPIRLKNDNLFLSEANVPDVSIGEGGIVDVGWGVANGATTIIDTDLDRCDNSANACEDPGTVVGYCYELEIRPSWIEADPQFEGPRCIQLSGVGATEQTGLFQFNVPQTLDGATQDEEVEFILRATGSGDFGTFRLPVTFEEGADQHPDVGSKEVDVDTGGDGGGGDPVAELQTLIILVIVFALILQFGGR